MAGKLAQYTAEEPARLVLYLTAALTATVELLAIVFGWTDVVEAAVQALLIAWMLVGAEIVRERVSPTPRQQGDQ